MKYKPGDLVVINKNELKKEVNKNRFRKEWINQILNNCDEILTITNFNWFKEYSVKEVYYTFEERFLMLASNKYKKLKEAL